MSIPRLVRPEGTARSALSQRSDDELMILAQAGSRDAFEGLVERHAQRLVSLCARFLNDTQLGRDAAQDTWVLVWQRRASYRPDGRFLQWLITVARNHCRNQKRRDKTQPRAELEDSEAPDSQAQIDRLLVEERRRRVRNALSELSPAMREALLLRYGEELPYDEMASVVGAKEVTLRSRVHHGLGILKQKLEDES
jgi:RNA polymerase sigma-70 factor (ECF subfamily)